MVMYALMTFPSTCFDALTCVTGATYAAVNRKRRVRQAALDVLAILGHIIGIRNVLELVQPIADTRDDGDSLMAAIKARLSRKQIPFLTEEGVLEFGNSSGQTQTPTQNMVSSSSSNGNQSNCSHDRCSKENLLYPLAGR